MTENQTQQEQVQKEPAFKILGTLGYEDPEHLDNFVKSMDIKGSIFVLVQAVNYAQSRGCFNLTEASVLATAIRQLVKPAEGSEQTESTEESQPQG